MKSFSGIFFVVSWVAQVALLPPWTAEGFTVSPAHAYRQGSISQRYPDLGCNFKNEDSNRMSLRLFSAASTTSLRIFMVSSDATGEKNQNNDPTLRGRLRQITGFSLTALRAAMRAATGISLTAIYASTLAVTGAWIRQTMKIILSIFPPGARYFFQPFLVLYYAPLFILKNLSNQQRQKQGMAKHESFVNGWKQAVKTADQSSSYWPLHVSDEGDLEKDINEMDTTEAVAESVEVAMEKKDKGIKP